MRVLVVDDSLHRLNAFKTNLRGAATEVVVVEGILDGDFVVNTYQAGYHLLQTGGDVYYLDHDFYNDEKTGMDLLKLIGTELPVPRYGIVVHSANTPAAISMLALAKEKGIPALILRSPWLVPGCYLYLFDKEKK